MNNYRDKNEYGYYSMNMDYEDIIESTKVAVLTSLVKSKLMDKNIADEWCETHTVIIRKKSLFKTITDKWKKEESLKGDNNYLLVVKQD